MKVRRTGRVTLKRLLAVLLAVLVAAVSVQADDGQRQGVNAEQRQQIAQLIEQLGSEQYALRERAQTELARLGPIAFDDLLVARHNSDVEIAQRAEYLIERMGIELITADDPHEVRQILGGYESLSGEERIRRMQRLSQLENWTGAAALCRLARYDDSDYLAKQAALVLLEQSPPESPEQRERLASKLEEAIGFSSRSSADWVRAYAATLRNGEAALPEWEQIVAREWSEYRRDPRESSRTLLLSLLRWQVSLLEANGADEQAHETMVDTLVLIQPAAPDVLDAIDWFMEMQAWDVLDQAYEQFEEICQDNPTLIYRLAEARLREDRTEEAQQLAQQALGIAPEELANHHLIGLTLRERGLFEWAEQEYRYVIDQSELGTGEDLRARMYLSDMLHDMLRDGEAAKTLQPAVDAMQERQRSQMGTIIARMHFYYAMHFAETGETEKQADHLDVAITNDASELDVLIAMYRLPDQSEAARRRTMRYIEAAREALWQEVVLREELAKRDAQIGGNQANDLALAQACNQYAWLVSNTEGDYSQARAASERSLELISDTGYSRGGYLDTLARCYYAMGDYEAALENQRQAVELEPHSGLMRRQLELFEAAYREHQSRDE